MSSAYREAGAWLGAGDSLLAQPRRQANAAVEAEDVGAQIKGISLDIAIVSFGRQADEPVGSQLELILGAKLLKQQIRPRLPRRGRGQ